MERIKLIINKIKNNTKTELPQDVEWKEFFVGDILDCKTTKPLIHTRNGIYNYVTRSGINNGVSSSLPNMAIIFNFFRELLIYLSFKV